MSLRSQPEEVDDREAAGIAAALTAGMEEVPPEEWPASAIVLDYSQNGGAA